jgi:hypothetical protein
MIKIAMQVRLFTKGVNKGMITLLFRLKISFNKNLVCHIQEGKWDTIYFNMS